MLYNQKTHTVIVTPPKCATTTIHQICYIDPEWITIHGPQPGGRIDKHTATIGWNQRDAAIYLMFRHPVRRALSLWQHYKRFVQQIDLQQFADTVLNGDEINFYTVTLTWYANQLPFDTLLYDIDSGPKIPIDLSGLPRQNTHEYPIPTKLPQSLIDWAAIDQEKFRV